MHFSPCWQVTMATKEICYSSSTSTSCIRLNNRGEELLYQCNCSSFGHYLSVSPRQQGFPLPLFLNQYEEFSKSGKKLSCFTEQTAGAAVLVLGFRTFLHSALTISTSYTLPTAQKNISGFGLNLNSS